MVHESVSMRAVVEASRRRIGGARAVGRATEKDDARANRGGTKGPEEPDVVDAVAALAPSAAGVRLLYGCAWDRPRPSRSRLLITPLTTLRSSDAEILGGGLINRTLSTCCRSASSGGSSCMLISSCLAWLSSMSGDDPVTPACVTAASSVTVGSVSSSAALCDGPWH